MSKKLKNMAWKKKHYDAAGKAINRWMEQNRVELSSVIDGTISLPATQLGAETAFYLYFQTGDTVYLHKDMAIANTIAYVTDRKMIAGTCVLHNYEKRRHHLLQSICENYQDRY